MFGKRLKNLRLLNKLSQEALSNKLNEKYDTHISKSMISRWERGQTDPQMTYVRIIADFFKVNPVKILDFPETEEDILINNSLNNKTLTKSSESTYNYFDCGISAGMLTSVDPFTSTDVEKIMLSDVILGKYAGDKDIFITHIRTESVNNTIPNKSLIAVKKAKSIKDLANGDIILFRENDKISIKRFYNDEKNGVVSFLPDSKEKEFFPSTYRYEDLNELDIIGKIITYIVEL